MQKKLTIWIPTKNRPDFLFRLLKYFSATGYSGYLFIGDSSVGDDLEKNKESIKKFECLLNIYYCKFPGLGPGQVGSQLVPQIETEFSSFLSDDDIIVTSSINSCVQYLIEHENVSGANGKSILFTVESGKAFGELTGLFSYSLAEILDSSGQARLSNQFSDMRNMNMCIHRTINLKAVFDKVKKLSYLHSIYRFEEEIGFAIMSIRGKVVQLPSLFLCRQGHPNQKYHSIDMYDWFTDKDWYSSFKLLEQTVVEELVDVDGIAESDAKEIFKNIFWLSHAKLLTEGWNQYQRKKNNVAKKDFNLNNSFRDWAKKVPGAQQTVRKMLTMRARLFPSRGKLLLPALLSPTSPYHKDFMPVYEAITKQPITQ